MDREREIDAILASGRQTRRSTSRRLWIIAASIGVLCLIGFVLLLVAEPGTATTTAPEMTRSSFATGLLVGGVIGVAIGFVLGRRHSSGSSSDHSSRSKP